MKKNSYIPRNLFFCGGIFSETEMLRNPGFFVVLAEPGAGKSDLLDSVAGRFGVERKRASIFRTGSSVLTADVLVLDAMDEVARIDIGAIQDVLGRAYETGASRILAASRSSRWDQSVSRFIEDLFGKEPQVVYLRPLNVVEQETLFHYYMPDENFSDFQKQMSRFGVAALLGNPLFLMLFVEAYAGREDNFDSKAQIFEVAVERLAHEANPDYPAQGRPPVEKIIRWTSEVFSKLLLSGAVGVSVGEKLNARHFPRLSAMVCDSDSEVSHVLDTRLVKPSDSQGEHEPVHRVVAEYCAARYLVSRIADPADLLTLKRCLAIIAPNGVVRDELRGLIGWMSALGDRAVQEAAIELDPYAVLVDGDPSQLLCASKQKLLTRLMETAQQDPYFRGMDTGRSFMLSGFFTKQVLEDVRPLLEGSEEHGHLRNLLLEMLEGSDAASKLQRELRTLMLGSDVRFDTRWLAYRNLVSIDTYDAESDCQLLIAQHDGESLRIAACMFEDLGSASLGWELLLDFFRKAALLYPAEESSGVGRQSRYFVKGLIKQLDLCNVEWLLDSLTEDLACACGAQSPSECHCRDGVSKVVGSLLDRYFVKSRGPFDPVRVWQWLGNLIFHEHALPQESDAVRFIQTNPGLRQDIQWYVLGAVTDPDEIRRVQHDLLGPQSHAGLRLQPDDQWALVDHAFENGNPALWIYLYSPHNRYSSTPGPDPIRTHMRWQANQRTDFLAVWAKQNRSRKLKSKKYRISNLHRFRRLRRKQRHEDRIRENNIEYLRNNLDQIQSGRHWGWLDFFSYCYLDDPDALNEQVDDPQIAEDALRNCLSYLELELPTLEQVAALRCSMGRWVGQMILHASCLAVFRQAGSLAGVKRSTLAVLKTDIDLPHEAIDAGTRNRFEAEVDKLLFPTLSKAEEFTRRYLEPQLANAQCQHAQVDWLRSKAVFAPLLAKLPIEWLRRLPGMSLRTLTILFDLAAEHADRCAVLEVIRFNLHYVENEFFWQGGKENPDLGARRTFWLARSFIFEMDCPRIVEQWLRSDAHVILELQRLLNPIYRIKSNFWPSLSAAKAFLILDSFIEAWPKVHLPNYYGTDSPEEETAYRYLWEVVWMIDKADPDDSLPVLERLISDDRFEDFHAALNHIRASAFRKKALQGFQAPTPAEIVEFLDRNQVASVEDMRQLLIERLEELQGQIHGGQFNPVEKFYWGGSRVDETTAAERIAEHLQMRLEGLGIPVTLEHQLKDAKRCDITATRMLNGKTRLLVIEVKGQWNSELFTAAKEQLHDRYAIHPDAEHQGIYLVLWFGGEEKIANKKQPAIASPSQLRERVVAEMPPTLRGSIDVFVLDLSR